MRVIRTSTAITQGHPQLGGQNITFINNYVVLLYRVPTLKITIKNGH